VHRTRSSRMVDGCDTFIVFLRKIIAGTSSLLISLTVRHTFEKHPFYAGAMLSPWRDRDDEHGLTQKTKLPLVPRGDAKEIHI